jgi:uncharacterized protein (TIGR03437 family)
VYFTSTSGPGIATTPGAYQREALDEEDGVIGRLDPTGTRLIFATYIGTTKTDWILRAALAPDGAIWANISSFVQCCGNSDYRLVRLSSNGERLLADIPIDVGDMAIDPAGDLVAIGAGQFQTSPDAFLHHSCTDYDLTYLRIGPAGEIRFATYLPMYTHFGFEGRSELGLPALRIRDERFEVVDGDMGVYAGCLVDAATFAPAYTTSPGAIVTVFGSQLGPRGGVAFDPGQSSLPTSLGGTRVLVNREPVPLLFVSDSQINLVLPYTLPERERMAIRIENSGRVGNLLEPLFVDKASLSLFRSGPGRNAPAAALNEDGSLNSPANPAKPGSRVVLFATGGGATNPPSVAGEITPLELRYLANPVDVWIAGGPLLAVEFAGAAPGLVAGVTQINVKLPDVIPPFATLPKGLVPLLVSGRGTYPRGDVRIAVKMD